MCSRAPEALNTCCAGLFPSPVLIACAGLHPAEHPWSSGARYPGAAVGAPRLCQPHSPACGRTPSEARGALQLSHSGSPEPHQAVTGCSVGLVSPPCPMEGGHQTPGPSEQAAGLLSTMRCSNAPVVLGAWQFPKGWWLSPGCSPALLHLWQHTARSVLSAPTARRLPSSPPVALVPAGEVLKGPKGRAAPAAPRLTARPFAIPRAAWVLSICLC